MKTLVVGAAMIDMVMVMDKLPKSGEDVMCSYSSLKIGGCAYNVASTLRNLECDFDLCVPVGNGSYGAIIEQELEKNGFGVLIKDTENDNGYSICMVEDGGERTFVNYQGVEGHYKKEYFNHIDTSKYDNVYFAGYQVCNENGKVISEWISNLQNKSIYFAPGPVICSIDSEVMNQIMDKNPVVHLNDKEVLDYTGESTLEEAVKKMYQVNHNLVIVTAGPQGAIIYDGNEMEKVPTQKANVVDTIGAGDSHIGAFIGGISKGLSVKESVKLANKVAGHIVNVQGPTMTKEEFMERMEK